jgi:hypothetical protein
MISFLFFISRVWPVFWSRDTNIYLVFSTFNSRPSSLLVLTVTVNVCPWGLLSPKEKRLPDTNRQCFWGAEGGWCVRLETVGSLTSHNPYRLPRPVTKLKLKLHILRPTVSRPVCLGIGHPPVVRDQILSTVGRLPFPSYGAPSLTTGRVCSLFLPVQLGLASPVTVGSKSRRIRDHILLLYFILSPRTRPVTEIVLLSYM